MTDRRRRAALLLPLPATSPGVVLLPRERKSSSSSPSPSRSSPDRWRGRHAWSGAPAGGGAKGLSCSVPGESGAVGSGDEEQPQQDEQTPSWGNQWSPRQPGRQSGGFGNRPGGRNGQQGGPGGSGGPGGPGGLRWDPTDPAQRRARYALLAGMWSFFFVLFSLPEVALLLGALAIYWGISSLRAKPAPAKASAAATTAAMEGRPAPSAQPDRGDRPGGTPSSPGSTRPQVTSAIAGLVTASLALMMVAATFTVQIVYRDYFACVNDALTQSAGKSCENLLPKELRPLLGTRE
ncbi:hypothetical protein [Streptomyces sp. WAC01526]|uniref:hypothetical protein n=1 Tax=Streptomyces sp. WAC01526 TaxID=2588709 RepID=UPI0011DF2B48|nr:hypothetical protein [Streptomyces sp. WAC01526]